MKDTYNIDIHVKYNKDPSIHLEYDPESGWRLEQSIDPSGIRFMVSLLLQSEIWGYVVVSQL